MSCTKYVIIDFETLNTNNLGLQVWHPEFKVVSCALLAPDDNQELFFTEHEDILNALLWFHQEGYQFLVYNAAFDCTIMHQVYGIEDAFERSIDVWRLCNYCNINVDDDRVSKKKLRDTSLPGSVKYFFGVENYKMEWLQYFIDNGLVSAKKKPKAQEKEAHAMVGQLPPDLLRAYNLADVTWTWKLFERCTQLLSGWEIDWVHDYEGYSSEAKLFSLSFLRGMEVDRAELQDSINELRAKIDKIDASLRLDPAVQEVERRLTPVFTKVTKPMIKKHKEECPDAWFMGEPTEEELLSWAANKKRHVMNWRSGKDKITLFIDVLGLPVQKLTEGGQPELSKKTLGQYGTLGKQLKELLKYVKELEECEKLLKMSEVDGKIHPVLRSGTTVSSRSSSTLV